MRRDRGRRLIETNFEESSEDVQRHRKARLRFKLQRWHASNESFLSSHGFVILFLTSYAMSVVLMFCWGAREEYMHTKKPVMRWFIAVARGCGYALNLNCGLVILLASRLTFTAIRETPLHLIIPFDKTFPHFHMIVGYVITGAVCGHGIFHLVWIAGWNHWKGGLWGINMCVGTGFALAIVLLVMLITSATSVRRKHFESFYFAHNIGAALFFALLLLHGVYNGVPYTYKWILPPMIIYLLDRLVRKAKIVNAKLDIREGDAVFKGGEVVRVSIPKQFDYRAGQYAELKIRSISRYEWHPFTIASAPSEPSMTFYIKAVGDWTKKLKQSLEDGLQRNPSEPLHAHIRGPYGAPAQHVGGFQRVVLISGGVGATPFCSICKELYNKLFEVHGIQLELHDFDDIDSEEYNNANSEIMTCVRKVYDESTVKPECFPEENDADEPYSLRDLFVVTNELSQNGRSPSPSDKAANSSAFSPARGTGFESDVSREPSPGPDKLKRMGLSFLSNPVEDDIEANKSPNQDWSFAKRSTRMDSFDAYNTVRATVLRSHLQRMLNFFHAIGVNVATYMLMLLRLMTVAMASIFGSMGSMESSSPSSSVMFRKKWITATDVLLGVIALVIIAGSLLVEVLTCGKGFFSLKRRAVELFVLVPLLCLSVSSGLHELFRRSESDSFFLPPLLHFTVVIPLVLVFLILRLHRIIGSRVLLADYSRNSGYKNMRAIDFIWTVPFDADDAWLREDLEHLANGTHLRLYRYVTRGKESNERNYSNSPGLSTSFGRPDWEQLFHTISERTPSNGKVGVFFCGPKGMSRAVREVLMKVQVLSNLRGLYLGTSAGKNVASNLSKTNLQKLRARGSNIRFVFREENFG